MQRLLDMVGAWSAWTKIDLNSAKCWYKRYQGRKAIHPDIDLTLNRLQLKKVDPNTTVWHFGILVELDQLCGSGRHSVRLDE